MRSGENLFVHSDEAAEFHRKLPVGTYSIALSQTGQFYLSPVADFVAPPKFYGDICKRADRILNTFQDRRKSTGALFAGDKGSGKTLLAKQICIQARAMGISTVLISQKYGGTDFTKFLNDIQEDVIIFFDEFEKLYRGSDQEMLLSILDGTSTNRKLFLLTCNDMYNVNNYILNRPGRAFYMIQFGSLEQAFIREYANDNLNDKSQIDELVEVSNLFDSFTFDLLESIVEEMNRYKETAKEVIKLLNAKIYNTMNEPVYKITLEHEHSCPIVLLDDTLQFSPFDKRNGRNYYISVSLLPTDTNDDGDNEDNDDSVPIGFEYITDIQEDRIVYSTKLRYSQIPVKVYASRVKNKRTSFGGIDF